MKPQDNDAVLVRRAQEGDQLAFADLYTKYRDLVAGKIANALGPAHRELTDDLVQESFENVSRGLEKFRGDSQFSTWLYRIVQNTITDALRGLTRQRKKQELVKEQVKLGDPLARRHAGIDDDTPDELLIADELLPDIEPPRRKARRGRPLVADLHIIEQQIAALVLYSRRNYSSERETTKAIARYLNTSDSKVRRAVRNNRGPPAWGGGLVLDWELHTAPHAYAIRIAKLRHRLAEIRERAWPE